MARPKKIKADIYKATIKVAGLTSAAIGSSLEDALSKLSVVNPKGKAILTVEKGEIKKERILMPVITQRLFRSQGLTRTVVLKNISLIFGF